MVKNHYRWDFIGLSADEKPTPTTSEKVTDGSTFYTSDTSKLYVWCKDNWYEKTVSGGGGGGTTNFNQLTNRPKYNGVEMTGTTNIPEVTQDITVLTDDDVNYTSQGGGQYIALWLLPSGKYTLAEDATIEMTPYLDENGPADDVNADMNPIVLITNEATSDSIADILIFSSNLILHVNTEYNTGNAVEVSFLTSPFTGTDGSYDGKAGLVPAPTTSDVDKFLKSDGTWDTVGGGSGTTVVQTIGTSTTDVMSQNAVTGLLFNSARNYRVQIGNSANASSDYAVSIGASAYSNDIDQVSIGRNAGFGASGQGRLCIGRDAKTTGQGAIALGAKSSATAKGEMNIGTTDTGFGYNSSNYRLLSGVYDGQTAHDAVTVGQVNATIDAINTALSTNIPHIGA